MGKFKVGDKVVSTNLQVEGIVTKVTNVGFFMDILKVGNETNPKNSKNLGPFSGKQWIKLTKLHEALS